MSKFTPAVPHPVHEAAPVAKVPPTLKVFSSRAPTPVVAAPEPKKVKKEYAWQVKKALGKPF